MPLHIETLHIETLHIQNGCTAILHTAKRVTFLSRIRRQCSALAVLLLALGLAAPAVAQNATVEIDDRCFGTQVDAGFLQHFVDGGESCDDQGVDHGGGSGADGVDAMDFDGDCDLDIITGWEESGQVFIYLNPTLTARPEGQPPEGPCNPIRYYPDNTAARTSAIVEQWPLIEVKREPGAQDFFGATEDARFGDHDGDGVADFVVIASEKRTREAFVSFPTCHELVSLGEATELTVEQWPCNSENLLDPDGLVQWHTFKLQDGDEYFMRAVVGDIDLDGRPDILMGSKSDENPVTRSGDIRWWRAPSAWRPDLWKNDEAPLPHYAESTETSFFHDLWGAGHVIASNVEFIMELELTNLVRSNNPASSAEDSADYPEILFTDRAKLGYMYLIEASDITRASSWRSVDIDNPSGSPFRWSWLGQLIDNDADYDLTLSDPEDPAEIVATYGGDQGRGVFARWYEQTGQQAITLGGVTVVVPSWSRNEVVFDGQDLPFKKDAEDKKINKSAGIADVQGDGYPEIIGGIRGKDYFGAFYLEPEVGFLPPRCDERNDDECDTSTEEWLPIGISPFFDGELKFDNFALIDVDFDCDVDVFTVEENGVGDKGLGVVWYENLLPQGIANQDACTRQVLNDDPVLEVDDGTVVGDEGATASATGAWTDADGDVVSIRSSLTATVEVNPDGTWTWTRSLLDGPARQTVTLTAEDDRGGSSTVQFELETLNVDPSIDSVVNGGPIDEGQSVAVTIGASDPAGIRDPLRYELDCDGDAVFEISQLGDRQGSCRFLDDGTYSVGIRVKDGDGGEATSSTDVVVRNVPPVITAGLVVQSTDGGSNQEGETYRARFSFADPGADEFSCAVDFGVGTGFVDGTVAPTTDPIIHTCTLEMPYLDDRTYTVRGRVSDGETPVLTETLEVVVENVAPSIDTLTFAPSSPDVNEPVRAIIAFSDPAGERDQPFSCRVDYGDGWVDGNLLLRLDAFTCIGPETRYATEGPKTVRAEVKDDAGAIGSRTATLQVINQPPVVGTPVVAPSPSEEGRAVTATVTYTDGGDNGPYTCVFDYGDDAEGDTDVVQGAGAQGTCSSSPYLYDDSGSYVVRVTVVDRDLTAGTGSLVTPHLVTNVAPTADFAATPEEIFVGETATAIFTNPTDRSQADIDAGFSYRYDCESDGVWETADPTLSSYVCQLTNPGTVTVRGEISDKDGGATQYSAEVEVLTAQGAIDTLIEEILRLQTEGAFNGGQTNSLIHAKLERAITFLDDGKPKQAIQELRALISQIEDFLADDDFPLSPEDGALLIETAQRIIDAIAFSASEL